MLVSMKQIAAGVAVIAVIVLIFGGYWWWLQVDSNGTGLFMKGEDEKLDVAKNVYEGGNKEPKSVEEVKEVACVGAGGVKKFNINGIKGEDSKVVQEVVYVRCGNGEEKEYKFDKKGEQ